MSQGYIADRIGIVVTIVMYIIGIQYMTLALRRLNPTCLP
jgi:hypothetical protein